MSRTTRSEAIARAAASTGRAVTTRSLPAPPTHLAAPRVTAYAVTLSWRAPRQVARHARYEVFRGAHRVGVSRTHALTDTGVRPSTQYVYSVRTVVPHGKPGPASHRLTVRTPRAPTPGSPTPGPPTPLPTLPINTAPGPATNPMTTAMVDRLWWRAGFGATDAERATWTGHDSADLVDFFLTHQQTLTPTVTPALSQGNQPIDPLASSDELIMEWLDTMQRATNPLTERMTFFWHRHFAVARSSGIPAQFLLAYRDRLRRYGDLAANPQASFRDLAREMTTADGAMSLFLTGALNVAGHPNENYAREFMELFTLGVRDAQGNPNYTQQDVTQLARALTGWHLDQAPASPTFGQVSFSPGSFDAGQKTIFGQSANWGAVAGTPAGAQSAVDLVLGQPSHGPFLMAKLWAEFIRAPIPAETLADLVATYTAGGGLLIAPVIGRILSHPLIFESIDEPDMIKPPVVYGVGVLRLMAAPLKWYFQSSGLLAMQQVPYDPPNVAGWEGGLAWLDTSSVQARFEFVKSCQYLKHNPTGYPGAAPVADVPGESAEQAFDRAYAATGSPWLSAATRAQFLSFAQSQPTASVTQRAWLQYALRALILGGPDGQVM
jgi:uncharacterized protein (DUF1800 family)